MSVKLSSLPPLPIEIYRDILSYSSIETRKNMRLVCQLFLQISRLDYFTHYFKYENNTPIKNLFVKPLDCVDSTYLINELVTEKIILAHHKYSKTIPLQFFSTKSNSHIKNCNLSQFSYSLESIAPFGKGGFYFKNAKHQDFYTIFDENDSKKTIQVPLNKRIFTGPNYKGGIINFKINNNISNAINCFADIIYVDSRNNSTKLKKNLHMRFSLYHATVIDNDIIIITEKPLDSKISCIMERILEINIFKNALSTEPTTKKNYTLISKMNCDKYIPLKVQILNDKLECLIIIYKKNVIDNFIFIDCSKTPPKINLITSQMLEGKFYLKDADTLILNLALRERQIIVYAKKDYKENFSLMYLTKFSLTGDLIKHFSLIPHLPVSTIHKNFIAIACKDFNKLTESNPSYVINVYGLKYFNLRDSFQIGESKPKTIDFSENSLTAVLEDGAILHFSKK